MSAVISKVVVDNAEELTAPLPTTFEMVRSALQGGNMILILGVFTALMNNTLLVASVFSVLYAAIFILIGWFINRKSEI